MILLLACVLGPGTFVLPPVDTGLFFSEVEPELGASCANPSCHGVATRPLEVFAPHLHRARPEDTFTDTPLTAEEHAANLARARGFVYPEDPGASPLLRKPLAPPAGGLPHGDGLEVYADTTDPGWRILADWAEAP